VHASSLKTLWVRSVLALVGGLAGAAALLSGWRAPAEVLAEPPLQVPSGFVDELVVGGILAPRGLAFAPDGRTLILERGAAGSDDINWASVRVVENGQLLATRALTLATCGDSERGLLGIALDPGFAANGYVYLYYTRQNATAPICGFNTATNGVQGPRNRVSRFTMSGNVLDPGSERVLIDNIITDVGYHNAGDLAFGADGYLYITTGEGGIPPLSQGTNNLNGKVLRILPTASASAPFYSTAGNPYEGQTGAVSCGTLALMTTDGASGPCREVYALGLRNPFRFTIRPGTSEAWVGDVGGGVWEEINVITAGANYGHPIREGACSAGSLCNPETEPLQPPYVNPVYAYTHEAIYANFDSAVIGGGFYTGTAWPSDYHGDYFLADFARGFVRRLSYSSATQTWAPVAPDFATGGEGLVGLKFGPDGQLYYLAYLSEQRTSELRRVRYLTTGENIPPIAVASASPSGGPLNTVFTFSASGSSDPDLDLPLTYRWDFGDGVTVTTSALTVTHVYSAPGAWPVSLVVLDANVPPGASAPVTVTVYPGNEPPTATIALTNTTAPGRTEYHMHDTWAFGVASASDDTPLPVDAFAWEIVFHHQTHHHPFVPFFAGSGGAFEVHVEEPDPVQWYRVILRVTDQQGQTTEVYRDIAPIVVQAELTTQPAGGLVLVDGVTRTTPYTLTRIVDYTITVEALAEQPIAGFPWRFDRWESGQPISYTLAVPPAGWADTVVLTPGEGRIVLPYIGR